MHALNGFPGADLGAARSVCPCRQLASERDASDVFNARREPVALPARRPPLDRRQQMTKDSDYAVMDHEQRDSDVEWPDSDTK
jgi:hypothetical protein